MREWIDLKSTRKRTDSVQTNRTINKSIGAGFNVDLDGRNTLITGSTASSSGIRYAIAKQMAEAGASVIVTVGLKSV